MNLEPEVESRVREYAASEGVSVEELLTRTFGTRLSDASTEVVASDRKAPRLQVLSREQAIHLNTPSRQRLETELAEARNTTPEEASQAEAEWQSFQQALNDNRRETSERLLFQETKP